MKGKLWRLLTRMHKSAAVLAPSASLAPPLALRPPAGAGGPPPAAPPPAAAPFAERRCSITARR